MERGEGEIPLLFFAAILRISKRGAKMYPIMDIYY